MIGFVVRMGLHTGETVEHDGNYSGSEVNRAARLMALAHGGQVLVSDTTEVLLRNRLSLRPLGEHVLRGLRGQISVYQSLRRSPDRIPGASQCRALRGQPATAVTSLVGRDELVRQGAELVRDRQLVTLTGVGGVGKTRMALEVGAELAGEFPDGRGGRAGGGRRSGFDPRRDRNRARDHTAGRYPLITTVAARSQASGCCSSSTTASIC